ncbi:hypothetical protein DF142_31400 [Burkholderia cenocepacia]|uniref:hypothetical protein n=1 Tax=Burkholderia cenocepacia TaxID=95486 RepID=UPI000F580BD1|nr:hypothetical protein [Burkholderia cenocepacia]RQU32760.1 hypothetical protein DF142_31400 [Burkholderia cenocepacia]RQU56973.1 hypothetical protein DF140_33010 [Burkholderia cenocepacia]
MPDEVLHPLSTEVSRAKCIQSADAYYALTAGKGDTLTVSHLLDVVYTAYFINEMIDGKFPIEVFRVAGAALHECAVSGERSGKFDIPTAPRTEIQLVLSLYLYHLTRVPTFIHASAEERAATFLSSDSDSPIRREPTQQPMH